VSCYDGISQMAGLLNFDASLSSYSLKYD